jgi:AraC-like DNA-binding protein
MAGGYNVQHRKQPERLTKEQYMEPSSSLRIFRQALNGKVDLHWHEFYELTFILSGQGEHILNGVSYPLSKGSLFMLTPADFHEVNSEPGQTLDIFNLIFSEEALSEQLQSLVFQEMREQGFVVPECDMNSIEAEFKRIQSELHQWNIGSELIIRGAMERILIEWVRNSPVHKDEHIQPKAPYRHQFIQKSLIYMQHHFREPMSLDQISRNAQLSPNYFSECFHKETGISFQTHLQSLRLHFAKSLLIISDLPVTQICYASGFNTLPHFEKVFKQKFGQSPRDYRKNSNCK